MRYWCLSFFCIGCLTSPAQVTLLYQNETLNGIQSKVVHSIEIANRPLFSFIANEQYYAANNPGKQVHIQTLDSADQYQLVLTNISDDTLIIKNVVPWTTQNDQVYITGLGDHSLSRTHLFLPAQGPINVIVPDNAWSLGYASIKINDSLNLYGLTKRKAWSNAERKRFESIVYPGGSVTYDFFVDTFSGDWHRGLKKCFQEHKLYDVSAFNSEMYQRTDLQWIRQAKMMHLVMAWDQKLYDRNRGKYVLKDFIIKSKTLYGGDDVIGIWPTWPALGMDQRNQWDMYRDMPRGLNGLKSLVEQAHDQKVKIFISYNPWDESTRKEDHLKGMADLIKTLNADGVILDTRGASSIELQNAADKVKPGVIMYSEGMAVPKDMTTIIAGRVHNALYYPPILNLNKLIQPEFGIFRVAEVYKEPIRREIHTALFNGYGIEFNLFHPGNPSWLDEQYTYLGKALRILREHSINFNSKEWQPLYPSLQDSVYINYWPGASKDIYSIYNSLPSGHSGDLFIIIPIAGSHYVDLWNHKEIKVKSKTKGSFIAIDLDPYPRKDQGSNNEGSVSVIARFDSVLDIKPAPLNKYIVSTSRGTHILIWPGNPDYAKKPVRLEINPITIGSSHINLHELYPNWDDDFIVQAFDSLELIDERIIEMETSAPHLVSSISVSRLHALSKEMIVIPSDTFTWNTTHGDEFIPYPAIGQNEHLEMKSFYMDVHPVTNMEYYTFIQKTKYSPKVKTNYLKHWIKGRIPNGLENHPVVYVSMEDALAYSQWTGKRLPTEVEWQYAAQTSRQWTWPWGNDAGIKGVRSEIITETLTHTEFDSFDSTLANPGNGKLDAINHYPKGINPFGLTDLVGSVWQMTTDRYQTGSYEYYILKGGSYYKPTASWWYVQGGPQPLSWRQMWLNVNEGFERSSTVGFRCVRDIK